MRKREVGRPVVVACLSRALVLLAVCVSKSCLSAVLCSLPCVPLLCGVLERSSFLSSGSQGCAAVLFSLGLGTALTAETLGKGWGSAGARCFLSEGRHLEMSSGGVSF